MMVPTVQLLGELEQALARAAFEDTPMSARCQPERLRVAPAVPEDDVRRPLRQTTNVAAVKEMWLTADQSAEILQVDREWL